VGKAFILLIWGICLGVQAGAAGGVPVYLFGGGPREKTALRQFVAEKVDAQKNSQILVITWATSKPNESFQDIKTDLLAAGADTHKVTQAVLVDSAETRATFLNQLQNATHVFLSGGDQNIALDIIESQVLRSELQAAHQRGVIFAGTSAGTAMMPDIAITGDGEFTTIGRGKTQTRPGLGLLRQLVDQHYLMRSRHNRLISLLLDHPGRTALGIDEGSAARIVGDQVEAFGPSPVVKMKVPDPCTAALTLELLPGTTN
jgi:cyanophycinase